ncbi:MAG: DUF819 family protein [Xanthomonadales bacterium]|nr:DUF819 family protein [Xanthomonadales bacterium]
MTETASQPWISNDAVVLGLLLASLAFVFWTANRGGPRWQRFYAIVPTILLCYLIPGLFNTLGIIDGDSSGLYPMARDYLLPTALALLTLGSDLPGMLRLGPKALWMFLAGTAGVVIGAPIALLIMGAFDSQLLSADGSDATWKGMTTLAGSWIGGGANQAAMKEVFEVDTQLFAKFVAVDVIVANIWTAMLFWIAGNAAWIDRRIGADTTAIDELRDRLVRFEQEHARNPTLTDLMVVLAAGFGITALAHAFAGVIAPWIGANFPALSDLALDSRFFWIVIIATTLGLALSFTRARQLEAVGASKIGSVALYVLVATIGMHIDITRVFTDPQLFALGLIWISVHAGLMLLTARLIRAPMFFMAVGSQANIGGAASAPVVASAFHPALAPVGVLLAVFGYTLGTYAAWLCGQILRQLVG